MTEMSLLRTETRCRRRRRHRYCFFTLRIDLAGFSVENVSSSSKIDFLKRRI